MCLGFRDGFEHVVQSLLEISACMDKNNYAVMFACKQGKDRSVLLARLLMEFRGAPSTDVVADKLLLTWLFR